MKQPLKRGLFLPPLFQLLLSGSGLLITAVLGLLFFLGGILGLIGGSLSAEVLPLFSMAWSALLVFALFLPSVVNSVRLLSGKEARKTGKQTFRLALVALLLWGPLVFLGQWLANQEILPWLFLPPLQLVAVAVPIWFIIEIGRKNLPRQASAWDVFSFGVVLTQPVILLVELALLLLIGLLVLVWASLQPQLMETLMQLAQRLQDAQFDPQLLEQILIPYLQQPGVIYLGLAVGAGLIPLIEELLKPLAVWVLLGRKFTEIEGFVLGLYAGGTFALLESLGMIASATESDWGIIVVARVGTAILHVTSTALVGWALGAAWQKRKYFQLGIIFFLAFFLHGVWNFFGLLLGLVPVLSFTGLLSSLNLTGPLALGILAFTMVLITMGANRRLQKQGQEESAGNTLQSEQIPGSADEAAPEDRMETI